MYIFKNIIKISIHLVWLFASFNLNCFEFFCFRRKRFGFQNRFREYKIVSSATVVRVRLAHELFAKKVQIKQV